MLDLNHLTAPASFLDPSNHLKVLLDDGWYENLWELSHQFFVATNDFWNQQNVSAALLPLTTGSISSPMGIGSDSSPVPVEIGGVDTYLADSMQFMLELGCRLSDDGCYYVMPSFRGEDADESHLCQFYHSEAELPTDLPGIMSVVDDYVDHLARHLLDVAADRITAAAGSVDHVTAHLQRATPRVTFDEAVSMLPSVGPEFVAHHAGGGRSLTRVAEQELMRQVEGSVWVTHMDHMTVPFYQAFADDESTSLSADLLIGVGETVGCGQRHVDAEQVRRALHAHGVAEEPYSWYVEMREMRPMLTSGFGLGMERFLMWVLRHDDIRDLQPLLRFNGVACDP